MSPPGCNVHRRDHDYLTEADFEEAQERRARLGI